MKLINLKKLMNSILFIVILTQFTYSEAKISTNLQQQIESLTYRPLNGSTNLMIAIDSLNNTWIKGKFEKENIYAPIIFQIPNAHIFSYDMYIYNRNDLHYIEPNLNSRDNLVRSRYAQYYIITDNQTYYLNLHQNTIENLKVIATERSLFAAYEATQLLYIGYYYGIATLSIIINFIFYFIFRDKRFLSYTALQFCIFVSLFYEDGMIYYISNGQFQMKYLLAWNVPITSLLACLFTVHFLDSKKYFKQYKVIFISLFSITFLASLIFTFFPHQFVLDLITILSFISPFFCLILAATLIKKNIYARFLLISFGVMILFAIGFVLFMNINMEQFSYFNINTFRFVSALETIIITFAIIYRVKDLQDLNQIYREEIDNYLIVLDRKSEEIKNKKQISPLDSLKIKYNLTNRETEVLTCLWEGMSNIQISEKLFISVSTVKYHVKNLYTKLEINNRSEALYLKKTYSK